MYNEPMGKKTVLLLGVVLIIAGFLRFYHLSVTPPGLYPDEAMDGNNALQALRTGDFKVFYPPNNGVEGLYANVEAGLISATGTREPWTLRFPSALFGFFTVLGTFFLARELFRKVRGHNSIALLSAFFLATSFWHVNFSRIGFRAIMAPFFAVWALYFLLRSVRETRLKQNAWLAVLGGIAFGLGFYSYISYRVMPLALLLLIPFFRKEKHFWRAVGIFVAATFLVALPLGLYFVQNPADFMGRTSQVSIFSSANPALEVLRNTTKTVGMLNFAGDGNWRHNFAGRPELFWPVGIAFWIGVALGLRTVFRKDMWLGATEREELPSLKFAYLLCFAWIALAALPVVFSNEGIPHALRAILMIPPIMILAAAGGVKVYEWLLRKFSREANMIHFTALVVLSLLAFEGAYTYFIAWGHNPNVQGAFNADYAALGREIRDLPQTTPKYIVIRAGGGTTAQQDPWDPAGRVQNIPIPAQTVMYLTDTYLPERQKEENIHYLLPADESSIPSGAAVFYIN